MPSIHLTDIVVSRLKTPGTYFDETTPAFGIRVGKNRKTWIVMRGQIRQRTRIGHYPAMSLADARKEARTLLTQPVEARTHQTFGTAYEVYKIELQEKKPRTQRDYKRILDKYFLPVFEKKDLSSLTYEGIVKITNPLPKSEKAHALAVMRTFLRWCVRPPRRYIKHSPLEGVEITLAKSRKRVLTDKEIPIVWRAAEEQGYPHGYITQLLILTGQRKSEIANLRDPWINRRDRIITLPEEICKNGLEHTFPYGERTAAILERIPRRNSTDLLFPSYVADDRPISGWSKYKAGLLKIVKEQAPEAKMPGWTLHDLRRTFATKLAELKVEPHIVERLLNHTMGSISNKTDGLVSEVAKVYNLARYLPEMRSAIETWEDRLSTLLAA
ncbi:tyrosine-type recombinase/integrase [Bradyrhizobium elkanii]|uniref:tyrosine-type recombinase/integrase n=1 Tax=Bradyrhizobium elkanii TaxID=29448 RepID=UPI003D1C22CF